MMTAFQDSVTVFTGGKLYIAGEYSVLTPGQSAVIKNVDIFMKGEITFSERYELYSDMYDYFVALEKKDENYSLIQETIETVNEYLELKGVGIKPFRLKITGKMEKEGKKYGIGSSGSVTVLTVKAMAEIYNYSIPEEVIFKLSAYVLMKRGDNGSMGDIACISYNSMILYTSFNRDDIRERIGKEDLLDIIDSDWGYVIEKIGCPENYEFLAGWTKKPSISRDMINKVKNSINEEFLIESENTVQNLKKGIILGDTSKIKEYINKNGELLRSLDEGIYSREMEILTKITENLDIPGKSSGAGGGDCGIAVCFSSEESERLILEWKKSGIETIYRSRL